jgi:hypothetical protein
MRRLKVRDFRVVVGREYRRGPFQLEPPFRIAFVSILLALPSPAHHILHHIKTRSWRYLTNLLIRSKVVFHVSGDVAVPTTATKRTLASLPRR